jgi:hypothetical protein
MDPVTLMVLVRALRRGWRGKGVLDMFGIRNTLAVVGLAVVAFGAAGWYLGWYKIVQTDDAQGHHVNIQVDPAPIVKDLNKAKEKVMDVLEKDKGTVPPPASTQPLPVPPPPVQTQPVEVQPPPRTHEVDSWSFPSR